MKTGFIIEGKLTLSCKRADGTEVVMKKKNMVVNWGLIALATTLVSGSGMSALTHIAMGSSSSAPALGNTALGTELRRDAAVVTQLPAPENNKVQFQKEHAEGAVVGTFREAGLFTAASGGNMFNRITFADFVVGSSDTLTVTWLVEIRNA